MKIKRLLSKFNAVTLAIVLSMPSSVPISAESSDRVSNSSGMNISIDWFDGEFKDNYEYNLVEGDDVHNYVKLKVSYGSDEVCEEGYDVGELVISVKGIGGVGRSTKIEADVGADRSTNSNKTRDWSYTWNAFNDTYTFTNNNVIKPNSVLSGYFDMVWEVPSRDSRNGYSQKDIIAKLMLPDGSVISSNSLSFSNSTKCDSFVVDIAVNDMYSYEGLVDNISNPQDYAYVRYNLGTGKVVNSRGLQSYRYLINPDVNNSGGSYIIINGSTEVRNTGDEYFYVDLPLENNYGDNYFYVAYPKDEYTGKTVETSFELLGVYYEGDNSGNTGESRLAFDSVEVVIPSDFNFVDIPGDIYQYWKDTYYDKYVSSVITEEQGGDIPGSKLVTGTTELFYLEGFFHKPKNILTEGSVVGASTDLGSVYSFEMVDDFIYILKNDGTYRQLGVDEYDFEKVIIPSTKDLLNINNIPIESGKYTYKVYEFKGGSKVDISSVSPKYIGYLGDDEVAITLSSGVTGLAIVLGGLDVSIQGFSVPVYVNFHIKDTSSLAESNRDNLSSGVIVNTSFVKVYQDDIWLNTEFNEDTYIDDTNLNLAKKDIEVYGHYLDRERDSISLYEGEKSDYEAYTKIDRVEQGSSYYYSKVTIGSDFYFNEDMPDRFSLYTVLPDYLDIIGYDIEEDAWDIFDIYAFGLDSSIIANRASIEVSENYKGSGRTYIGIHFDLSGLDIDKEGFTRVSFPVRVLDKYFSSTSSSLQVRSVIVIDKIINEYSVGKYSDNGSWCIGDSLIKDVDNDGNDKETLSYDFSSTTLTYVDSSELQMSKFVETPTSEGFVQLPNIPLAEEGNIYRYRLSVRSGESVARNIVITDILETGSNSEWSGVFNSIDLSEADNKGMKYTVWYSNSENPGSIGGSGWVKTMSPSEVESVAIDFGDSELASGDELNIYINMVAPSSNSLVGKVTENGFSASFTMVDKATGNVTENASLSSNLVQVRLSPNLKTLVVTKVDVVDDTVLEGAKFKLLNKATKEVVSEGVTNSRGQIIFKKLPNNVEYILEEVEAPYGYELSEDIDVILNDPEVTGIKVGNTRKLGRLELVKKNALDNLVDVEGAVYGVYDLEGDEVCRGTTDSHGKAILSNIPWGSYYVEEITSPDGYALDGEKYYFDINRDNVNKVVKFNVSDKQSLPTSVRLVKYGKLVSGVQTDSVLSGAVFKLLNVTDGRNSVVGLYVTDDNGEIVVNDLAYGDYRFIETRVPVGYKITDEVNFSISPSNPESNLVVYNQRMGGSISVYKHDDIGNAIEGIDFDLYDSSKERVLDTYTSNKYGNISIKNLEWGTYYLKEKSTLECYELNDDWFEVVIDGNNLNAYLDIENVSKKGSVVLTKTNEIGNVYLSGAVFNLYSSDGSLVDEGLVTDSKGQIKVEGLKWGSYYFKEVKAPNGYGLTDDTIRFVVNSLNAGTEQSITVSNPQDSKTIIITKKIYTADINFENGSPTFLFKVYGDDVNGNSHVYQSIIKFDKNYVESNTDEFGFVSQSVTVSGILSGRYTVTEEESSRYSLSTVSGIGENTSVSGESVLIDLTSSVSGEAVFTNDKYENGSYSDNDSEANVLKKSRKLTGLKATWLSDTEVTAREEINKSLVSVEAIYDDGSVAKLKDSEWVFGEGFVGNSFPNKNGFYLIPVSYTEGGITKTSSFGVEINSAVKEITDLLAKAKDGYSIVNTNSDITTDMFEVTVIYSDNSTEVLDFDEFLVSPGKAPSSEGIFNVKVTLNPFVFDSNVSSTVSMSARIPEPYLVSGAVFKSLIPTSESLVFTDEVAPSGVDLIDLSEAEDGYVVGWLDGTTFKVSSQRKGVKVIANEDCSSMFAYKTDLTSLDLSYLDTSRVVNMKYMFRYCYYLEELDVTGLDTSSAENMYGMFYNLPKLKSLNVINFNTDNVTDMTDMFGSCGTLTALDLSSFNTKNVKTVAGMFKDCSKLTSVVWDTSKFTTDNMIDMSNLFYGCRSLSSVDVSKFNTEGVTDMSYMFGDCDAMTSIELRNFNTSNVTNMYQMFWGCSNLKTLDVSSFDTSKVNDMGMMFAYLSVIEELDLSSFKVYNSTDVTSIVIGCDKVKNAYARSQGDAGILNASLYKPTTWDFVSVASVIDLEVINNAQDLVTVDLPDVVESGVTDIKLSPIEDGKLIYSFEINGVEVFGNSFSSPVSSGTVTISNVKFIEIVNECPDKVSITVPDNPDYGLSRVILNPLVEGEFVYSFKLNGEVNVDDGFAIPVGVQRIVISEVEYLEIINMCPDKVTYDKLTWMEPGSTSVSLKTVKSNDILYSFKLNGELIENTWFTIPLTGSKPTISDVVLVEFDNKCPELVTVEVPIGASPNYTEVTLKPTNSGSIIKSFVVNGELVEGNKFIYRSDKGPSVVISNVVTIDIINQSSDNSVIAAPSELENGEALVSISSIIEGKVVASFRLNGVLVEGDSFTWTEDMGSKVYVSEVTLKEGAVIESEHNPYPNKLNTSNADGTSGKVYGEVTFDGATSLNVSLDYETESTSYDWIYLYDSEGNQYGKYGGSTRTVENITIPGNYVKVMFITDYSGNDYYGFKATITPVY